MRLIVCNSKWRYKNNQFAWSYHGNGVRSDRVRGRRTVILYKTAMVDSLTDSFSSIVGLPDQLHSKYASLHISSRAKLSPRKDQECNSEG